MSNLSQAVAQREQLRRLHNTPGYGDNPEWRRDVFKPTQHDITIRELAARKNLPKFDEVLRSTVGLSKVNFPVGCNSWESRLEHLQRLRGSFNESDEESHIINLGFDEYKHEPDTKHFAKLLPDIRILGEIPPDPIEDLENDWTSVDEFGTDLLFQNSGTKALGQGIPRNATVYVYLDKDPGYFLNFEHLHQYRFSYVSENWAVAGYWGVSNVVSDFYAQRIAEDQSLIAYILYGNYDPNITITLRDNEPTTTFDTWAGGFHNTEYYATTERTGGSCQQEIRTTSHSGTLQDTIVVSLNNPSRTYRYVFAISGWDTGSATNTSVWTTQNFDLQYTAPGNPRNYGMIIM